MEGTPSHAAQLGIILMAPLPQKELILTSPKSLGYIMLIASDGTDDVGVLKHAHIVVALLSDISDDLKKIVEHQRIECLTKVYGTEL